MERTAAMIWWRRGDTSSLALGSLRSLGGALQADALPGTACIAKRVAIHAEPVTPERSRPYAMALNPLAALVGNGMRSVAAYPPQRDADSW
jgi:hypothetical protein